MNVLAIGNSHLAAFKAACEALLPDCGRVQYLPSPRIVNAGDFFGGRTLVARLQFRAGGGLRRVVAGPCRACGGYQRASTPRLAPWRNIPLPPWSALPLVLDGPKSNWLGASAAPDIQSRL